MKKEEKEKKEMVILDEGMDMDALIGPDSFCCGSMLIPLRN